MTPGHLAGPCTRLLQTGFRLRQAKAVKPIAPVWLMQQADKDRSPADLAELANHIAGYPAMN